MSDWLSLLILAVVQGVTEFLPISSSAHLILASHVLGWNDQGLVFDVAVHFGSLLAVSIYFRRDLQAMVWPWWQSAVRFHVDDSPKAYEAWCLIVATLPAVWVGYWIDKYWVGHLRSVEVIACATVFFGLLLAVADKCSRATAKTITLYAALLIGLAQVLALIPGTSRSGITMTAALFLGFHRQLAARFSFLLSIPLILAATSLKTMQLITDANRVDWWSLVIVTALSGISAFVCIHWFLQWINRIGFMPFVYYRLLLGAVLFAFLYWPNA